MTVQIENVSAANMTETAAAVAVATGNHMRRVWAKTVAVQPEMSQSVFDQLLESLVKSEEATAESLKVLFSYSLTQMVEFENTAYMNQIVQVLTPRNRSLVVTLASKCSLFKFNRKVGQFEAKRQFNNDVNGQEAESAAIEYAENNYNYFETVCESNIWAWDSSAKKPKLAKRVQASKPVDRMVNAMRLNLLDCETVADLEKMIESAKAEFVKEFEFSKATKAKNPDMDRAGIARLYKKSQENKA